MQSPFGDDFPEADHGRVDPETKPPHQHETWQMQDHPDGGKYCAACGARVTPPSSAPAAPQIEGDRSRSLPVSLDLDLDQLSYMLDELAADHTRRNLTEAAIRDKAISIVNTRAAARTAAREQRLAGGEVTSELDIRAEAVGAADDADVLRAFSRAFGSAAKQGDVLTAELVGLLPPRGDKPRRSFTVADGHGFDLKASSSPNTKAFAELDVIIDVITATLVAHQGKVAEQQRALGVAISGDRLRDYGSGVRAGIASILEVISSPTVKTTALDSLGKRLQAMDEIDLAKRLAGAYGRKEYGEPTTKVERVPSKAAK